MGYYVNPPNSSKEAWLNENGVVLAPSSVMNFNFSDNFLPVCLVDNGPFTAAAICYNADERDEFARGDGRSKKWYAVSREALAPYYKD
jgi:hypothetical protein